MHERLAAGEYHPLDAETLDIGEMPLEFGHADLFGPIGLPDVAHHAAAVAAAVGV